MQAIRRLLRLRPPFFGVAGSAFLLAAGLVFSACYSAGEPVSGQFRLRIIDGTACGSQSGWCAFGPVDGDLFGNIYVRFTNVVPVVDDEGKESVRLTGTFVLARPEGQLQGTVEGCIETATGRLRSTMNVTHGTERYRRLVGTLDVWGSANLETRIEEDGYSGRLYTE